MVKLKRSLKNLELDVSLSKRGVYPQQAANSVPSGEFRDAA